MLDRILLAGVLFLAPAACLARASAHDIRHPAWRRRVSASAAPERAARPPGEMWSGPPDWKVQYGYVKGPASGSLGAMLEGRNPAAGAIP